mgnify:CR=1 FL=1
MKKICSVLLSAFMAGVLLAVPAAADDASVGAALKYKSVGAGAASPKETFKLVQVGDGKIDGTEETAPKLIDKGSGSFVEVTFAEKAAVKDGAEASGYFVLPKFDKEGTYTYTVAVAEGNTAGTSYDKNNATLKITVKKDESGAFSYKSSMEAKPENVYSAGTVAVKTAVTGSTGAEEFEYVIKLSAPKDKKIKGAVTVTSSLGGEGAIVTPKDGGEAELSVSVKVKNGETVTLSNVPYGVTYTVTQKAAKGYKAAYTGAAGTVNKDTPAPVAAFTNTAIPTITVTANTVTADYDGKTHGASGYTVSGALAEGHKVKDGSVVISGSAVNAGEYAGVLVPSGAVIVDANGNDVTAEYYLDYVNGSITVNRRQLVITANDNTVPYDGKAHGGNSYTVSGVSGKENTGLLPGHEVKNVAVSGEQTAEGTYENGLIPSGAQIFDGTNDVTANYDIIYASGKLTITHVHEWGEPTYEWTRSTDGKGYVCIATRTCKRDSTHKETETAAATYAVVTAAQCEKDGLGRYTAVFKNSAFTKQTKDIAIARLGHDIKKTWSYDKSGHWNACTRCKEKFNFHSHDFTEWRTVLDDKGRDTDEEIRYCKDCNYSEKSRTIHIKPDNGGKKHEENPNTGAEVIFTPAAAAGIAAAAMLRK